MHKNNRTPRHDLIRALGWITLIIEATMITAHTTQAADQSVDGPPQIGWLSDNDFLGQIPIVLSATRLSQPASDAPVAITVIDRAMIEASGAREIADLFRLVPGFQVGYVSGHWQTVTYHGFADPYARRMQVLIDGRSAYTPTFGGVEWSDVPIALDDIDRIEVVRGPNMASYGTNAFLATINVITRHAAEDAGTRIKAMGGSKGVGEGYLHHGGTEGNLDYRLTLGYREDDGFDNRYDSKQVSLATLRTDYRHNMHNTLMVQLGFNAGPRGMGEMPEPGNITPTNNEHTRTALSHYQQIRWQHSKDSENEISLQISNSYHRNGEAWLTPPLVPLGGAQLAMNEDITAKRYDIDFQHTLGRHPSWRLAWGAGMRLDEDVSPTFFGNSNPGKHRTHRLFANGEWHITSQWLLNAGAMIEKNDITGTDIAPRMALNYHLTPHHSFRASVSKALRTPILIEHHADYKLSFGPLLDHVFLGNENLNPEIILSHELGYIGNFTEQHLLIDIKLFRDITKHLISTERVPYPRDNVRDRKTRLFINGDNATLSGIETQIKYQPWDSTQIILNYAYADMDSADTREKYTKTAPFNSTSLLAMYAFSNGLKTSATYYYTDPVYYLGTDESQAAGALRRLDVRLAYQYRTAEIAFVAQNVLKDHQEYVQKNVFDTRWYGTLAMKIP